MKASSCDWAWMVDAGDDGRLSDEQQVSFRRHGERCAVCGAGVRGVGRLRARMAAVPTPAVTDFEHHRQRQLLLARAGGVRMTASRSRLAWPRRVAFSALALAVVGVGAWRFASHRGDVIAAVPRYEVTALRDATWTNEENGTIARVKLARGSAAFHVHKLNGGQRFFVTLPDGEIEVRGTRFVVDVVDGRTRYVVVMEGKVALRQGEGGERLLLAGDRWDAPAREPAVVARRQEPEARGPAPIVAPNETRAHAAPVVRPSVHPAGPRHAERVVASAASPPARESSRPEVAATAPVVDTAPNLFARGMSAFRAGRYADAEALWRQFVAEHPQDPRIEDIAFLRAVVRARLGDVEGAAALARTYLDRFPRGMRRKEAEALTRHPRP